MFSFKICGFDFVNNGLYKYNIPSYEFNFDYPNEDFKTHDQTIGTILNLTLPIGENGNVDNHNTHTCSSSDTSPISDEGILVKEVTSITSLDCPFSYSPLDDVHK